MLFNILLSAQILVCLAMAGLILIQRSEGGALGMGGGPSGFMSARGVGNLMTKTTWVLAFLFFSICIALTIVGQQDKKASSVTDQAGSTLKLDQNALKKAQADQVASQQSASSSSASSDVPSLSQLPMPSQQVVPNAPTKPSNVPSPDEALKHLNDTNAKLKAASSGTSSSAAKTDKTGN